MKIETSSYTLGGREGALLKVCFRNGMVGYADLHPWESLGDLPLKEQLSFLKKGVVTRLTNRSFAFAAIDARARSRGHSLFDKLKIPRSHYLIPKLGMPIEPWLEKGFTHFKLKVGRRPKEEISYLKSLSSYPIKFRLDFNTLLTETAFEKYLGELQGISIDFCEDPFPFYPPSWNRFKVCLAADHGADRAASHHDFKGPLVIKPAILDPLELLSHLKVGQRCVVTSYLDHPLGQLASAYVAAHIALAEPEAIDVCGFASHLVYSPSEFSEQLTMDGATLIPPEGTGFGFDSLLKNQPWESLDAY